MGVIGQIIAGLFGSGRNVVAQTAQVFRVNAEAQDRRAHIAQAAALAQFGEEFRPVRRGLFDRVMDALNRVPRPAMALGTLGLFASAMIDPVWFAARMAGISLVPEPLWWLLGAIVSFYFGARHQAKGQDFQREVAMTLAATRQVAQNVHEIEQIGASEAQDGANPALADWRAGGAARRRS